MKYIWTQVGSLPPNARPYPFLWSFPKGNENVLTAQYTSQQVHTGSYSLKIEFRKSAGAYGGLGVGRLPSYSVSKTGFATFWLRGTSLGQTFEFKLKDIAGKEEGVLVMVATTEWEYVSIPLARFAEVDLTALENFNLGFTEDWGSVTIYIDDVEFTEQELVP